MARVYYSYDRTAATKETFSVQERDYERSTVMAAKIELDPKDLKTRSVSGVATPKSVYKKVDQGKAFFLTHTVIQVNGRDEKVLCNKIKFESMLDDPFSTDEDEPPTCSYCLARDIRFK